MGLKITTDDKGVRIFRKDGTSKSGNKYTFYSMAVSSKNQDGTYSNAYIDCKFKKGVEVANKSVINIKNAFPTIKTFGERPSVSWMITDFDVIEAGETQIVAAEPQNMSFLDIPEGIEQELPFT